MHHVECTERGAECVKTQFEKHILEFDLVGLRVSHDLYTSKALGIPCFKLILTFHTLWVAFGALCRSFQVTRNIIEFRDIRTVRFVG